LPVLLADVARSAGVSIATASRVVSGSSYKVSSKTRERVLKTVDELGYTPNALARALVTDSSPIIGIIVGSVTDPYFAEICRGVEDFARPHDLLTIVCNADRNLSIEMAYLEMLRKYKGLGIIFAGGMYTNTPETEALREVVRKATEQGIKVVSLGDRFLDGVPTITADHRGGLYDLTNYLLHLGHIKIAFVEGPPDFTTSTLRRQGYLDAMKDANLEPLTYPGSFDYQDGRNSALRILSDGLPEAIVAFNDDSAVGVLNSLKQAGVKIPQDVSVAGVDNIRYAEVLNLTTVEVPMYQLGAMAAKTILNWEEDPPPSQVILPHRVVPRGTTARRVKLAKIISTLEGSPA
jgi:LacI family transcriptional regulator